MDYGTRSLARVDQNILPSTGGLVGGDVRKENEINREMSMLNERIEQLKIIITGLGDRISPILHPEPPSNPEANKIQEGNKTDLGRLLNDFNTKLYFCTEQLKDIKNRVEL